MSALRRQSDRIAIAAITTAELLFGVERDVVPLWRD
jgi:hypothetical protein